MISLNDIKSYFPPGTGFEDYWPTKVMDSQLLVNSKGGGSGGGWTKQPPTPPATKPVPVQNNANKATVNARAAPMHNILPRGSAAANTSQVQQRVSQPRPVATTHPAHSSPTALSSGRSNIVTQPILNTVQSVNGWTGLVGGQPTFQTPLVSQASSIIRMPSSTLNMHNVSSFSRKYLSFFFML